MASNFSPDRHAPPSRFRPNVGQMGANAAERGLRQQPRQPRQRASAPAEREVAGGSPLGLPQIAQAQGDNRHLLLALMHRNSTDLGRDLPFGLWAQHHGYLKAISGQPDAVPYDWIEDA